jgi:hypothetical protein
MRTRRSWRNQERLYGAIGRELRHAAELAEQKENTIDPDATWKCLIEALKDLKKCPNNGDTRAHVVDCLEVLAKWLRWGGYPPTVEEA